MNNKPLLGLLKTQVNKSYFNT